MKALYRTPRDRVRQDRRTALAVVAMLAAGIAPAWALRPVQVYEVTVRGAAAATVVSEGLRQALVRATGRRTAAADPQLAPIIQNAAQYLKSSRSLAGGAVQLDFDGVALAPAIVAAGASVWDSNRPFLLVAVSPVPTGVAADALRVELERAAEERGLPISVVPIALADANGAPLSDAAVLQSAQTLGADAVLIGRSDASNLGQWQWHLVNGFASNAWSGGVGSGVDGAADLLASVAVDTGSKPLVPVAVEVTGVATLTDYARVEQLLRSIPGVQSSGLAAAVGNHATFTLSVHGGGEALVRALAGSGHLAGTSTGESQVQLNYVP